MEYPLLSLRQGSITKERAKEAINDDLRWAWYVVGEFTVCYPENLQNNLAHAQAVDTRPSSPHTRGPGTRLSTYIHVLAVLCPAESVYYVNAVHFWCVEQAYLLVTKG